MSYAAIDQLTNDPTFNGRVRAAVVEQSETFQNDQRPDMVALADEALRGGGEVYLTFSRIAAAGPGMAAAAGDPPDQARIVDADILASVQANYPTVAALYFDEEGTPLNV